MLTVTLLLALAALVVVILVGIGRAVPLWVAVLFLVLIHLLQVLPR